MATQPTNKFKLTPFRHTLAAIAASNAKKVPTITTHTKEQEKELDRHLFKLGVEAGIAEDIKLQD